MFPSPFPSFFLGGFECSTHRRADGHRLDLVAATRHEALAAADYAALAAHGIRGARDGVRWHLVERVPGEYDWSSVLPLLRAARAAGVRVAWDLSHYGYPDHVNPWGDAFADALARFAAAFARLAAAEEGAPPILCPVNEISFWAWAGGEVGYFNPGARRRGEDLKRRLVRASLLAARAARDAVPGSTILSVDPLVRVVPRTPADAHAAAARDAGQFEAWDALLGHRWPDLGGDADGYDVMGVNLYWNNQWFHRGRTIRVGHPLHRPFRHLLIEAHRRTGKPLIVAETSIEGAPRAAWLRHLSNEVRGAIRAGVPVGGICLYPVLSHPGWTDDRYCPNGLFEMGGGPSGAGGGPRPVHAPLAGEVARQSALFDAMARGEDVPDDATAARDFRRAFEASHRAALRDGRRLNPPDARPAADVAA